jgi:hypothetical protein
MTDNINIGLKGHIIITSSSGEILFEEHNEIESSAITIVARCLTQLDFSKAVDKIRASGNFTAYEREVTKVDYNAGENSVKFTAVFFEEDFDGIVTKLELRCGTLNLNFAKKEGLNLAKDNNSRIQVDWKIYVS